MDWMLDALAWVVPVVLAITLHEAAHGWMAERFGDDTARIMGRVTFNPMRHVDPFGTLFFPAFLLLIGSPVVFGYAKPVPVDFTRLSPPKLGTILVSVAGVGMNLLLAILAGLLLHLDMLVTPEQAPWIFQMLYRMLMLNCVLIVFNLLPILPLDGGRVVDALLSGVPKRIFGKLERYGIAIVFALLLLPPFLGYDLAGNLIGKPTYWLIDQVLWFTGNSSISE